MEKRITVQRWGKAHTREQQRWQTVCPHYPKGEWGRTRMSSGPSGVWGLLDCAWDPVCRGWDPVCLGWDPVRALWWRTLAGAERLLGPLPGASEEPGAVQGCGLRVADCGLRGAGCGARCARRRIACGVQGAGSSRGAVGIVERHEQLVRDRRLHYMVYYMVHCIVHYMVHRIGTLRAAPLLHTATASITYGCSICTYGDRL